MCYIRKYLAYVCVSSVLQFRARSLMQLNKFNSSKELRVICNRPCAKKKTCLLLPWLPFYRALVFCVHLCCIAEHFSPFSILAARVYEFFTTVESFWAINHVWLPFAASQMWREHVTCLECFFLSKRKTSPVLFIYTLAIVQLKEISLIVNKIATLFL